ncbi:Piwi-domain-containing protein [Trichodelitschia bisporula]|uniref:Piwi-domain-containing protein n=1 Tax=Trichodelitschia bisporula TaxID=703511 RepID=A0A6G1HMK3_9PEZI|nr:Piwi-domain-containing protein [Trichodelitschia bisporula]
MSTSVQRASATATLRLLYSQENALNPPLSLPKTAPAEPRQMPLGASSGNAHQSLRSLLVRTNYLRVTKFPKTLYQYEVTLTPGAKSATHVSVSARREKEQVFKGLGKMKGFQDATWATDLNRVWSIAPLWADGSIPTNLEIPYSSQTGFSHVTAGACFTLTEVHKLNDRPLPVEGLNAIVMKHVSDSASGERVHQVGANKFFHKDDRYTINESLTAIRGYFTSIRPVTKGGLLLNVNTCASAFFRPVTVATYLQHNRSGQDQRKRGEQCLAPGQDLVGVLVRIIYDRDPFYAENDPNMDASSIKVITEVGYPNLIEAQRLNADLKVLNVSELSPIRLCVNLGSKTRKEWYHPECLQILPYQPFTKLLQPGKTTSMIKFACKRPEENLDYLRAWGLKLLGINDEKTRSVIRDKLELDIDPKFLEISAARLSPPKISYRDDKKSIQVRDAQWNLAAPEQFPGMHPEITLRLLNIARQPSDAAKLTKLKGFYNEFRSKLVGHGMKVKAVSDPLKSDYISWLPLPAQGCASKFKQRLRPHIGSMIGHGQKTIMLVVLSHQDQDIYAAVKSLADCELGLRTVCCLYDNAIKDGGNRGPLLSNLALKFNFKLGCPTHTIQGLSRLLLLNDTIIMGADVTHPTKGSLAGTPSIAAVVAKACDDQDFTNFVGSMRLQEARTEVIDEIGAMTKERLKAWRSKSPTKTWPKNILFYRDGISETQYNEIWKKEVLAIEEAYKEVTGSPAKLTFVVVGKRHHTRFFPISGQPNGSVKENVPPGVIVDHTIVAPNEEDGSHVLHNFFLQSHCAVKGTGRSAHYVMLRNVMELPEAKLQEITHNLCYAYSPATKGISYCAPAYYADRLCTRGRMYLRLCQDVLGNQGHPEGYTREDQKRWRAKVAKSVASSPEWNPRNADSSRTNPWHPNFDNLMFYV